MEAAGADAFVDDTELDGMINASYGLWHGMVAQAVPERFEAVDDITADGSASYALPADYYRTLAVEHVDSQGERGDLSRVMFRERNRFPQTTTGRAIGYRLSAGNLVLIPAPASGSYKHVYVTNAEVLSAGGDSFDGVNGWEEWIVYDVAIKMLLKEEAEASTLIFERNRIEKEIRAVSFDRDMANPRRIVDVRKKPMQYNVWGLPGMTDPDFWFGR